MMLFKSHKQGFILSEVVIALFVIGTLLVTIMNLQYNVTRRIAFNSRTSTHFLELKKNLYHFLMKSKQHDETLDLQGEATKISLSFAKTLKRLDSYKISKTWESMAHKKEVEYLFCTVAPEKKNEK